MTKANILISLQPGGPGGDLLLDGMGRRTFFCFSAVHVSIRPKCSLPPGPPGLNKIKDLGFRDRSAAIA